MIVRRLRPLFGIGSQLLNAGTNVATAYLASLLLVPEQFGLFVIGFAGVSIALATGRGLVGSTMLAHLPSVPDEERAPMVRSAFGFSTLIGLAGTVVLGIVSMWVPAIVWFVPWVLVALLHDVARHALLAVRRRGSALALDVVWALVQGTVVAVWALTGGSLTIAGLAAAWGVGALAGLLAFLPIAGAWARPAHPRTWVATTRDVAGWFSAVSVLGQVEVYVVLLLTGVLLAPADAGGLRAVQLLVFQPPMVLLGAILGLLVPAVARHGAGSPALGRVWLRGAATVVPVSVVVLVVAALAGPLMDLLFGQYTAFTPLVLPVALQSALIAFTVPTLALLAGTRRGRLDLGLHLVRTSVVLGGVTAGALLAGPSGLAWGLACATAVVVLISLVTARRLLRHTPTPTGPAPAATTAASVPGLAAPAGAVPAQRGPVADADVRPTSR